MDENENENEYYASQAAYGSRNDEFELLKKGYKKDMGLSNEYASVFGKGNDAILAYRGTKLNDARDLRADVSIAFNLQKYDPEFKEAREIAKKVSSKYKGKLSLTGHSLGGTKAIEVGKDYRNAKITAYNPGTGIVPLDPGNATVYHKYFDPISSRIGYNSKATIKSSIGTHSLSGFAPIKKVNGRTQKIFKRFK